MQSFDRCEECIHVAVDDDPLIHEANPLTAVIEDWPDSWTESGRGTLVSSMRQLSC